MSFALLDDNFADNPHVIALTANEFRLYVCALARTERQKPALRGTVHRSEMEGLARQHRLNPKTTIAGLLTKGRWETTTDVDVFRIHDYADLPRRRSEAAAKAANARWANTRDDASASDRMCADDAARDTVALSTHSSRARRAGYPLPQPTPLPKPIPPSSSELGARTGSGPMDNEFVAAWLDAAKAAGHSEFSLVSGVGQLDAATREAAAAGETSERIHAAVQLLATQGRHSGPALAVALRQITVADPFAAVDAVNDAHHPGEHA